MLYFDKERIEILCNLTEKETIDSALVARLNDDINYILQHHSNLSVRQYRVLTQMWNIINNLKVKED